MTKSLAPNVAPSVSLSPALTQPTDIIPLPPALPAPQPVKQPIKGPTTTVNLILGGIAGFISATALQPLDLLKTRLQQQQLLLLTVVRVTLKGELAKLTRIKELWRGVVPLMLRTGVGAGLYFTCLLKARLALAGYKARRSGTAIATNASLVLPKLSPLENLLTGFVARALVGYVTMPITVIKTRYESNMYHYRLMKEAVLGTYYDGHPRGSIRNFFTGSMATLARDLPYAGLYVLFYEASKAELPQMLSGLLVSSSSLVVNSALAFIAASLATTVTGPFDAIKTRLQLNNQLTFAGATRQLCGEPGGFLNLFRGLSLRLGRKGLSAAISWCVYEELIRAAGLYNSKLCT